MTSQGNKKYLIPERILEQLEEIIGQLQNIFLDIFSNYDLDDKDK